MQMASEVMTRNVQSISPDETIRYAAQMMDDLNVGVLPVCEGERLVGIVTDRDITVRATSAGLSPDDAVVDDVMSTDVRWCFEDQPLDEVMKQMIDTQVRRVPVISHETHRVIGIVSLGDITAKSGDVVDNQDIERLVQKISSPAEPDRLLQGKSSEPENKAADTTISAGSDTGIAGGLAGSDVLEARINPNIETSATEDPSNLVEVSPDDLVNKNAPGSTTLARRSSSQKAKKGIA